MITINLFDDTFRQSECSVAWGKSKNIKYVRDKVDWGGISLFTDGYISSGIAEMVDSRLKIGWLHEPKCLHPHVYKDASPPPKELDYILTYDKEYLEKYSDKARFMPYGGVWIPEHLRGIKKKTKLVSMLYGAKMSTDGHRIRHDIAAALDAAGLKVDYYGFRGTPTDYSPETKYKVLADYMFSIVVETCREDYLFTEILLDCFAVGTIPIFWGCPTIGGLFSEKGIWPFSTVDECVDYVRLINEPRHWLDGELLKEAREYNFVQAMQYAIPEDWMYTRYFERKHDD